MLQECIKTHGRNANEREIGTPTTVELSYFSFCLNHHNHYIEIIIILRSLSLYHYSEEGDQLTVETTSRGGNVNILRTSDVISQQGTLEIPCLDVKTVSVLFKSDNEKRGGGFVIKFKSKYLF